MTSVLAAEFGLHRDAVVRHAAHHLADSPADDAQPESAGEPSAQAASESRPRIHRGLRASQRAQPLDSKQRFLEVYAETGNVSRAARQASVRRERVYGWLEHDEQFKLAFNQAEVEAVELLEAEARERATRGGKLVREVWRGDRLIERIVEYRPSDAVLVKLLQALRPERYGDKLAITQTSIVKTIDAEAYDSV